MQIHFHKWGAVPQFLMIFFTALPLTATKKNGETMLSAKHRLAVLCAFAVNRFR